MIVAELDIVRITLLEAKADTPLIVHRDCVLTGALALERVQPIARWHAEVHEAHGGVDAFQLPEGTPRYLDRHALRLSGPKQRFRRAVDEGFDHQEVYRVT